MYSDVSEYLPDLVTVLVLYPDMHTHANGQHGDHGRWEEHDDPRLEARSTGQSHEDSETVLTIQHMDHDAITLTDDTDGQSERQNTDSDQVRSDKSHCISPLRKRPGGVKLFMPRDPKSLKLTIVPHN